MKQRLTLAVSVGILAAAANLLLVLPASAHRLDEYLQATTISLAKGSLHAELRLTPGVAVFPTVIKGMDTDNDGVISPVEQRTYAGRVLRDLTLTLDGKHLTPRLASYRFASVKEMKNGVGESEIVFDADVPHEMQSGDNGRRRQFTFENHHQSRIAVYLVNCLVPSDPNLRVTAQNHNYQQSWYRLDYLQSSQSRDGSGVRQTMQPPPYPPTPVVSIAARGADTWAWRAVATASAFALIALLVPPTLLRRRRHSQTAGNKM